MGTWVGHLDKRGLGSCNVVKTCGVALLSNEFLWGVALYCAYQVKSRLCLSLVLYIYPTRCREVQVTGRPQYQTDDEM
jgi:hypothetical protein